MLRPRGQKMFRLRRAFIRAPHPPHEVHAYAPGFAIIKCLAQNRAKNSPTVKQIIHNFSEGDTPDLRSKILDPPQCLKQIDASGT